MRKRAQPSRAQRSPSGTTVFLGGGRITGALIAGLRLAGYDRPIVVHDRNPEKLRALQREFCIEAAADLKSAVSRAETIIIAVRPNDVADLLNDVKRSTFISRPMVDRPIINRPILIRPTRTSPILAISLAAGIPLKKLRARLEAPVLWARAMPSPVCRIGRGLTAVTFDHRVPRRRRDEVVRFFAQVGAVLEMPETRFDAFSAAYSPSHGYHALATLANAARASGLDSRTALIVAAHALADALVYWCESGETVADLLHESATPGGIAAATMAAMKKYGYEKAVAAGLRAGIDRARRNARL